jgi:hypothetical protein
LDYVRGGQPIASGQPGFRDRAAVDLSAFGEKLPADGAMDRAVDPTATQQRGIRRVDDHVDLETGTISGRD